MRYTACKKALSIDFFKPARGPATRAGDTLARSDGFSTRIRVRGRRAYLVDWEHSVTRTVD